MTFYMSFFSCSLLLGAVLFSGGRADAQSPSDGGVVIWAKGIPQEGIKHKDDFGNHALSISHREANGRVEVHTTKADVFVIQSGEADLVTGGKIQEAVTTAPNELQGSSIQGGVKRHVGVGDVIHIPVGVPHQFFVAPGTQITYLVVKVVDPQHAAQSLDDLRLPRSNQTVEDTFH
jgi:mannose-6-phosphate isomerase-like protein (cupin superfamily)